MTTPLASLYDAIRSVCTTKLADVPLEDDIPDDVNAVPCLVVGWPEMEVDPQRQGGVMQPQGRVFIVGNRQTAGDTQRDLLELADRAFIAFGGGKNITQDGEGLMVASLRPRVIGIAGQDYNMYDLVIYSAYVIC